MKILFLVRQLNIGGAERQLVIVATNWCRAATKSYITSFYTGGRFWLKQLDAGRVRLISLEKRSRAGICLIKMYVKVLRVMRQSVRTFCMAGCIHKT